MKPQRYELKQKPTNENVRDYWKLRTPWGNKTIGIFQKKGIHEIHGFLLFNSETFTFYLSYSKLHIAISSPNNSNPHTPKARRFQNSATLLLHNA